MELPQSLFKTQGPIFKSIQWETQGSPEIIIKTIDVNKKKDILED